MVSDISTIQYVLLVICLVAACAFEFVNGFHDTANAVATVIYTNTLKPWVAVVWSGICNFIGVMVGGITVAMGIVNLLPAETLTDPNIYHSIGMILALLFSAIIWNLGTWYFRITCIQLPYPHRFYTWCWYCLCCYYRRRFGRKLDQSD